MDKETVSILGCGWLGVPLAKHLLEKGFSVKGSVTSPEKFGMLSDAGILPFQIVLSDTEVIMDDPDFFNCNVLIISIPPRRIEGIKKYYPAQIGQLIPFLLNFGIQKVIFISSTSVYPEDTGTAKEEGRNIPDKASGKALVLAENLLKNLTDFETTIIRFGGLIGADRNPARFLLKSAQPIANAPVNLIHQEDCIGIISAIIGKNLWGETLNACCPEHPLKKDFYGKAAQISGLPEPIISNESESFKIVDSSKLQRLLKYKFKYSSPMEYLDDLETNKK
ncbi:MAG: SDR family NAD(P)-dependent oxidoreductase [Bacteroidota bacterium]|nr:NAD(P)-dependent oxidoreductase [Odoribacter sp.]MDP3643965.1 SDR family NAD(P)-dependent oxidoreductase [Bacteroidota bacterium]